MSRLSLLIEDRLGSRRRFPEETPIAIGGPDADLRLLEGESESLAWIGVSDGDLFVQPAPGVRDLLCNGERLEASHWLRAGDELRLRSWRIRLEEGEGGDLRLVSSRVAETPVLIPPPRPAAADHEGHVVQPIEFRPKSQGVPRRHLSARSIARWAVTLFLLSLVVVAGFVLTARSVEVEVEPGADRLTFAGGLVVELGGRHLMRPGSYTLSADRAGYRSLTTRVEITDEAHQTLRLVLERLPGWLDVSTGELRDAEVLIDGELVGKTPLGGPVEVAAGEHELRVSAPRHQDHVERLTVEGAGQLQSVRVELAPRWAPVRLSSEPPGAAVRIDGRRIGTTPLTAELGAGSHRLDMVLPGRKAYQALLRVVADQAQTLPTVQLPLLDGMVRVTTHPAGATVLLDGEFRGETPLRLELPPRQGYRLELSKAGHRSQTRVVDVESNQSQELELQLVALKGEVRISAWPPKADLRVDGVSLGGAKQTLLLPARPHEIELVMPGYERFSRTVTPLPDLPQVLEVRLRTLAEIEAEAMPPILHTGEGHELRLIAPGRFRMGAPRRQPGRRSNEVTREVELTRRFYVGTQEVTNRQFRRFREAHLSGQVGGESLENDHHPVVRVSWQDAVAYCNWLSRKEGLPEAYVNRDGQWAAVRPLNTGYRLPTEAEWAWVARFADGEDGVKYPWGDSLPVPQSSGNYGDVAAGKLLPVVMVDYRDGFPTTAPADAFLPNPLGLFNLGGNVAEWVHDYYGARPSTAVERDPLGPEGGEHRVIRGSSWRTGAVTELRLTYRDYGTGARPEVGFRIARYAG